MGKLEDFVENNLEEFYKNEKLRQTMLDNRGSNRNIQALLQ